MADKFTRLTSSLLISCVHSGLQHVWKNSLVFPFIYACLCLYSPHSPRLYILISWDICDEVSRTGWSSFFIWYLLSLIINPFLLSLVVGFIYTSSESLSQCRFSKQMSTLVFWFSNRVSSHTSRSFIWWWRRWPSDIITFLISVFRRCFLEVPLNTRKATLIVWNPSRWIDLLGWCIQSI